jgi:hypothetical protein
VQVFAGKSGEFLSALLNADLKLRHVLIGASDEEGSNASPATM